MRIAFLSLLLIVLAGTACNTTSAVPYPSQEEIAVADCGERPDEDLAKWFVEYWVKSKLKDPESARIEYSGISRGTFRPTSSGGPYEFAWQLTAFVNAKNSYGGYTGKQAWPFFFRDDIVACLGQPSRYGILYIEGGLNARDVRNLHSKSDR